MRTNNKLTQGGLMSNDFSTSLVNISADERLSIWNKLRWIYFSQKNNRNASHDVDQRIKFENFETSSSGELDTKDAWGFPPVSPPRYLCDCFWSQIDLSPLCKNGVIRALEVGCGTGIYGLKLQRKLGGKLGLYRGIDIVENPAWREFEGSSQFEFHVERAESVGKYLTGVNLIFTQSAVEHFKHDLVFFYQLRDYIEKSKEPVWQIHLMPSAECLQTFLWHGFRQYTPRTISNITRIFSSASDITLYRLGGCSSNSIHKRFITWPALLGFDLREKRPHKYLESIMASIKADEQRRDRTDSSFYALVIKSEGDEP